MSEKVPKGILAWTRTRMPSILPSVAKSFLIIGISFHSCHRFVRLELPQLTVIIAISYNHATVARNLRSVYKGKGIKKRQR
jgi:hypothetical protein